MCRSRHCELMRPGPTIVRATLSFAKRGEEKWSVLIFALLLISRSNFQHPKVGEHQGACASTVATASLTARFWVYNGISRFRLNFFDRLEKGPHYVQNRLCFRPPRDHQRHVSPDTQHGRP